MKRGREPLKDTIARNAAALRMYAASAPHGKSREPLFAPEIEKTKRKAGPIGPPKLTDVPHESTVQRDGITYLQSRADIDGIVRTNSGMAVEGDRRVRYNICYGKQDGEYMVLLDVQCLLKPHGRHVEIEFKRANWKRPTTPRELKQAARIAHVRACGGIACFATSIADVRRALDD